MNPDPLCLASGLPSFSRQRWKRGLEGEKGSLPRPDLALPGSLQVGDAEMLPLTYRFYCSLLSRVGL